MILRNKISINLLLIILLIDNFTIAGRILIIPSSIFPVHRFTMSHIADELVKRKHSVTWLEFGYEKVG